MRRRGGASKDKLKAARLRGNQGTVARWRRSRNAMRLFSCSVQKESSAHLVSARACSNLASPTKQLAAMARPTPPPANMLICCSNSALAAQQTRHAHDRTGRFFATEVLEDRGRRCRRVGADQAVRMGPGQSRRRCGRSSHQPCLPRDRSQAPDHARSGLGLEHVQGAGRPDLCGQRGLEALHGLPDPEDAG
jgi:hypothetical protein